MSPIVESPKSTSFLGLVGRMLGRLSRVPVIRSKPRHVNFDEFSPHLLRDMGLLDGYEAPGRACGPDAPAASNDHEAH